MNNFIVVQAHLDYDYVEGVDYIAKFNSEEEANKFISDKKEKQDAEWSARCNYINEWVDAIELPETDYNGWKEFLATWGTFSHPSKYIYPKDFKNEFKRFLMQYYSFSFEGYNPPAFHFHASNLFIIEVKDE